MISDKLQFWCAGMASLAADGKPIPAETVALWADAIERMLPVIAAMEERPIPHRFRIISGGKGNAA